MERYVDGFLIPIAKENLGKYKEMAELAGQVWKEHGALEYYECVGDDLNQQQEFVSFTQSAGASEDEIVVLSWIVFESKEHRDRVNAAVMADHRIKAMMDSPFQPFDCKRMAYGGFKTLVKM